MFKWFTMIEYKLLAPRLQSSKTKYIADFKPEETEKFQFEKVFKHSSNVVQSTRHKLSVHNNKPKKVEM